MSKFTRDVTRRLYKLECGSRIQTEWNNNDMIFVDQIQLKRIVLAILDHLNLEIDHRPRFLELVDKDDNSG